MVVRTIPILQDPHPILRKKSEIVKKSEFGGKELQKILDDMQNALTQEEDGVAIAAPQIGVNKRIFVIAGRIFDPKFKRLTKTKNEINATKNVICINPEIIKISKDKKLMHEGCLSVRPLYGDIRRASRATIQAQDENGHIFEMKGSGLLAEIFQHENDHLDGILFIDKAINIRKDVSPDAKSKN